MNLQWYHLIPFVILFQLNKNLVSLELPKPSENAIYFYYIAPFLIALFVLMKSNSNTPIEDIIVILSFAAIQKIALKSIELNKTTSKDRDLLHPFVIAAMLIAIKYNIVDYSNIKSLYLASFMFSLYTLYLNVKPIDTIMLDYFVVHCLFYFLKH